MKTSIRDNNYFKYTVLFLIAVFCTLIYFLVYKKSLVWHIDGYDQHVLALSYYGKWLRGIAHSIFVDHSFHVPMWDTSIGFGGDIITTLSFYVMGDPSNLLSAFIPIKYTEFLYGFLIVLRLYLSGLTFIYFMKKRGMVNGASIGAIIYVFTGFVMFAGVRHPFFVLPMVYLPLILAGIEKILEKKKPYLFILSLFLMGLSNFYFFYMIAIVVAVYGIIRSIVLTKDAKKVILVLLKTAGYALISVLMCGIILFPTLLAFFGDSRSDISMSIPLLYEYFYYLKLPSAIVGAGSTGYHWTYIGVCPISFITLYYSFKNKDYVKVLIFAVCLIILCVPLLGSFMNGFSYTANRWIWAFVLFMAFTFVQYFKDLKGLNILKEKPLIALLVIYTLLVIFLPNTYNTCSWAVMCLLIVFVIAMYFINSKKNNINVSRVIALFVLINVALSAFFTYHPTQCNYIGDFMDLGKVYKTYKSSTAFDIKKNVKDKSFYRFSTTEDEFSNYRNTLIAINNVLADKQFKGMNTSKLRVDNVSNSALIPDLNGMSFYFSMGNNNVQKYLKEVDNKEGCAFFYYGLDQRAGLTSLLSNKYFITEKSETKKIPFGYKVIKKIKKNVPNSFRDKTVKNKKFKTKYYIYKNKYALPLTYTYDSYATEKDVSNYNGLDKEEIMLNSVITDREVSGLNKSIKTYNKKIDYKITNPDKKAIEIRNNKIIVKHPSSVLDVSFNDLPNQNLYIYFKDLNAKQFNPIVKYNKYFNSLPKNEQKTIAPLYKFFMPSDASKLYFTCGSTSKILMIYRKNESMYSGRKNYIVNLGNYPDARKEMTIRFEQPGVYSFDDLEFYTEDTKQYTESIDKLKQNYLEDVKITPNCIKGNIDLDRKKMLVYTLPYSKGWTAKVNDKNVKLNKVNYMCNGILLNKGKYNITLKYFTPGLKIGILLSLIGFVLLVVVIIFERKKANGK